MARRGYPPEFRRRVVELVEGGRKVAVDYWLAREAGTLPKWGIKVGDELVDLGDASLTKAFAEAVEEFSKEEWLPLLPVFWQVFLWGWGGFLLVDRVDEEYGELAAQKGIPAEEVPTALAAFDAFFGTDGGWFRNPSGSQRRVLQLMPPSIRGLGAYHRLELNGCERYEELNYSDRTTDHLIANHNATVRLLDAPQTGLVKYGAGGRVACMTLASPQWERC